MRSIFSRYKRVFFVIVFLIIAIPIAGFLLPKKTSEIPIKNFTPVQKTSGPCAQFPTSLGAISLREISCEEAIRIAVKKYEGAVQKITQGSRFRKKDDIDTEGKDIWIIELVLKIPIQIEQDKFEKVRVFLDRKTGEELSSRYQKI